MIKRTLGIDVGTASTAIILIEENTEEQTIKYLFNDTIIYPFKELSNYNSGNKNFKTNSANRREYRGSRVSSKNKNRVYKEVVKFLKAEFGWEKKNRNLDVNKLKLEGKERILDINELCAVIYNYSKYRGFNFETEEDENSEYKEQANELINWCKNNNKTVTEYFVENNINFHKNKVVDGKTISHPPIHETLHREELMMIIEKQKEHHNLTDEKISNLLRLMYFKKPIPSQKHLVSDCEFEKNKKTVNTSNPFFQRLRILESVRNIRITVDGEKGVKLSDDETIKLYNHLLTVEVAKDKELLEIIGRGEKINFKQLKGSITIGGIKSILPNVDDEILYDIWQKIYSHKSSFVIENVLINFKGFEITSDQAKELSILKLEKTSYCAYSEKAIKKLIPYMNGELGSYDIYDAKNLIYPEYFEKSTIKKEKFDNIKQNSLRNPVVEKSWNQIVSVMNKVKDEFGEPDETKVELARELRLSKKVREKIYKDNLKRNKLNSFIKKFLISKREKITHNTITRVILWMEQGGKISKDFSIESNAVEIYSGKEITIQQALEKSSTELEHTLCKSRFNDNSRQYLTLSFCETNTAKDNRTALEFVDDEMTTDEKIRFKKRIKSIYKGNNHKLKTFEYAGDNFPELVPSNQLAMTSYIAKKFVDKIEEVFYNVTYTNGKVTSWIRNRMNVSKVFGEFVREGHPEAFDNKLVIRNKKEVTLVAEGNTKGKRVDHRHHIVDAFIIAITKQSYIQTLNNMNKYYMDTKGIDTKLKVNQENKIINDIKGRFGEDNIADMAIDIVKNTIVKVKRANHPIFFKDGKKGVRGLIHKEKPIKKRETIDVYNKNDKGKLILKNGERIFNKKITKDNICSSNIKDMIEHFDSINQAFSECKYLSKLDKIKVYVDTSEKIIVNNNMFKTSNNHKIEIFKKDDCYSHNVVSLSDFVIGKSESSKIPFMTLHKKDYVVIGLTDKQIDKALSKGDMSTISKHLYYVAKISATGIVAFQRHYFSSNTIDKVYGNFNSLMKNHDNKIVKMKIFNNGGIARYQKNYAKNSANA